MFVVYGLLLKVTEPYQQKSTRKRDLGKRRHNERKNGIRKSFVVCGLSLKVSLEFGIWNLEFGIWNLEFGCLPYFIDRLQDPRKYH